MGLDERVSLIRQLEILEDAIAARFQRNPALYYNSVPMLKKLTMQAEPKVCPPQDHVTKNKVYRVEKSARKVKQVATQQHEIKLFLQDRTDILNKLSRAQESGPGESQYKNLDEFKTAINGLTESNIPKRSGLQSEKDQYAMFSSSIEKPPTNILSARALELDINAIFNREEQYGTYIQLENYHPMWLELMKEPSVTVLQYLESLERMFLNADDKTSYLTSPPIDRDNKQYLRFLERLGLYLKTYIAKKFPLIDQHLVEDYLLDHFKNRYVNKPVSTDQNTQFCPVCDKRYEGMQLFNDHLLNKFHAQQRGKRLPLLQAEFRVSVYLTALSKEFKDSKNFMERKLAFTYAERQEELQRLTTEYEAPNYNPALEHEDNPAETDKNKNGKTHSENKQTAELESMFTNMPLGPDGMPIPLWLYKLQGLDVKYTCEICGNAEFKGRRAYQKHFHEPLHEYRLKCLGITRSKAFDGIALIEEAQELWAKISGKSTSARAGSDDSLKLEIEVEDEDGNVMSQTVYQDLKRQGLL
ncbi:SF3a splicing factor complex subunit PRP9 KNAG_0K01120 [Huiozyma naganishii CBS 8797]|uniref:C2H2-type domain-containing protein n=1 Tax=Huiozyma naganishii (strain ATCC MYA-139 / BCRC 22969 / CBS 8797 / KCTC 17520 / NBRC 10181 / NCYC 3082 / Yp74L-3) TaxID=1071383 RepID=J7S3A2_HUIN7|nr:hypothetical protein KNAG_0K01120 [Kazachstania naganishii CBS 8797]CCK72477.1 hypothetical protein KNAG_0K01120 [Kazachstania naganishii CBS 8797]